MDDHSEHNRGTIRRQNAKKHWIKDNGLVTSDIINRQNKYNPRETIEGYSHHGRKTFDDIPGRDKLQNVNRNRTGSKMRKRLGNSENKFGNCLSYPQLSKIMGERRHTIRKIREISQN